MHDPTRVEELQPPEYLVHDELDVVVSQLFSVLLNEVVQVHVHQVGHQVDVPKRSFGVLVVDNALEVYYVIVTEIVKDSNLSNHPLSVYCVFDLVHPLDCHLLACLGVFVRTHDPVRPFSFHFDKLVSITWVHVVFAEVCHFSYRTIIILNPKAKKDILLLLGFQSWSIVSYSINSG